MAGLFTSMRYYRQPHVETTPPTCTTDSHAVSAWLNRSCALVRSASVTVMEKDTSTAKQKDPSKNPLKVRELS